MSMLGPRLRMCGTVPSPPHCIHGMYRDDFTWLRFFFIEVANITSLICMRYARILAMFNKMPWLGAVDGLR